MGTPKLSIEVSEISVQLGILSERLDQREKRLLRDIEALQNERRQVVNLIDKESKLQAKRRWDTPEEELTPEDRFKRALEAAAPNTRRQYVYTLRAADKFFGGVEISDSRLADYIRYRFGAGKSPNTIEMDCRAIRFRSRNMDQENPYGDLSKNEMKRIRREGRGRGRGKAKPLLQKDVDRLIAHAESEYGLRGLRDAALVSIAFEGLLRISEVAELQVSDLDFKDDGTGVCTIAFSKTDQGGKGEALFIGSPVVRRMRRWLKKSGIKKGPVFRKVFVSGRVADRKMTTHGVRKIIQGRAAEVGIKGITGHSLRRGMAQQLTAENVSLQAVADAGRWKTANQVLGYVKSTTASRGAIAQRYQA